MFKTKITKSKEVTPKWYLIDAKGRRLGKIASIASQLLLDKANPVMRDYLMPQAKVVIINASQIDHTEKKAISKLYTNYSGFPGGLKISTMGELMAKFPERVIEHAISGMLPKTKRGKQIMSENLYVYPAAEHAHSGQQAEFISIDVNAYKI
ncbi:MAG: 50S ribosomal protein L13 [Candidatus Doudnabacteria bacterium]|nr:50S ribosomal protein L13 [Candidatus Doudnabacteria bacterium]